MKKLLASRSRAASPKFARVFSTFARPADIPREASDPVPTRLCPSGSPGHVFSTENPLVARRSLAKNAALGHPARYPAILDNGCISAHI
jgi:hypothetical protein